MVSFMSTRKSYFLIIASLLATLLFLAACGGTTASAPKSATNNNNSTSAISALMKLMTQVGQPTVKILSGTTFEVNGQIKNGDHLQHDITLQATLLDASGRVIATATQMLDNVKGGATVSYNISGNTPQPTWQSVEVTVIKISENINGAGSD